MRLMTICLLAVATTGAGRAAEALSAFDFLIDGKRYVGQTVTLHGCTVIGSTASLVMCNVIHRGASVGNVFIDGDAMDRTSLRRALTDCSDMRPSRRCEIAQLAGKVRVNSMGDVRLDQAVITWR